MTKQDATVWNYLLFPCSLTALHVSSDIIAHQQEHLSSYSAMTAASDRRE